MAVSDFLENGKWKCTQCGACCKMVRDQLPDFALADGSCRYLIDSRCSIYDTRPDICRVELHRGDMSDVVLAQFCEMTNKVLEKGVKNAI